jgi:CheY-like chemotaxis protein
MIDRAGGFASAESDTEMLKESEIRRVLIVDDEPMIADTLAIILNQNGFAASATYSGEQALESASTVRPNVVITDVILPGMTGIEAGNQIAQSFPDCRIILLSGRPAGTNLNMPGQGNEHRFELLLKPIHPQAIIDYLNTPATPSQSSMQDPPRHDFSNCESKALK